MKKHKIQACEKPRSQSCWYCELVGAPLHERKCSYVCFSCKRPAQERGFLVPVFLHQKCFDKFHAEFSTVDKNPAAPLLCDQTQNQIHGNVCLTRGCGYRRDRHAS